MAYVDRVVRYGMQSRYDGECGLCGAPVQMGERIFQLPKKRTGASGRWVCGPCRWPDPERVIDLDFVIRKGEHRIRKGPTYTPSMVEIDLIVTAMGYLDPLDDEELELLKSFQRGQQSRRSPTLTAPQTEVIVSALRRARGD